MDLDVEEMRDLCQAVLSYHPRQLWHALTAEMLAWTVKVRYH